MHTCLKTYRIAVLSSNSLGLCTLNCCFLAIHQFVHQCEHAAIFRQVTSCERWLQWLVHIFQHLSTQKANGKLAIARKGTENKTESIILLLCKRQCTRTLGTIWLPHWSTVGRAIEGVEKSSRNPRLETRISIWEKRHQDGKQEIYSHKQWRLLWLSHHTEAMSDRTSKTKAMFTWHMKLFSSSCCGNGSRNVNEGESFVLQSSFWFGGQEGCG